jgi:cytochrome c oxidase subunit 4
MSRQDLRSVVLAPVLTWLGLLVALAATCGYAFLPGAPLKPWAGLAVAAFKAALIVFFFMRLRRAVGLVKLTAAVGLLWLSLLFILGFCDFFARMAHAGG